MNKKIMTGPLSFKAMIITFSVTLVPFILFMTFTIGVYILLFT